MEALEAHVEHRDVGGELDEIRGSVVLVRALVLAFVRALVRGAWRWWCEHGQEWEGAVEEGDCLMIDEIRPQPLQPLVCHARSRGIHHD